MKKKLRLKFVGLCFLALFTTFTSFSPPAFADPIQGGAPANSDAAPIDPAMLAAILLAVLLAI